MHGTGKNRPSVQCRQINAPVIQKTAGTQYSGRSPAQRVRTEEEEPPNAKAFALARKRNHEAGDDDSALPL